MRHFYIFQIREEIKKITYTNPYELFHTLETIYYQNKEEVLLSYHFLNQIILPINQKDLDIALFKHYKENYFYTKYRNIHNRKENTCLTIHKTYMKLETDVIKPRFFEELEKNPNFFLCDFEEKDYFWLSSLEPMKIG